MSLPRTAKYVLACLALSAAPGAAHAAEALLVGGPKSVWLIRSTAPARFDLFVRLSGKSWQWACKDATGAPAAAAAVGDRLHVLLRSRGYLIFEPPAPGNLGSPSIGRKCAHPLWPADARAVAACAAGGLRGARDNSIVAMVPRSAGAASRPAGGSPPAAAAAKKPAGGGRPARLVRLGAFQNSGAEWEHLGDLEGVALGPATKVLPAVFNGTLYVLVSGGPDGANRLDAWRDGQWRRIELAAPAARADVVALVRLPDGLVAVLADGPPAGPARHLSLAAFDLQKEAFASMPQPVTRDGDVVDWSATGLPQAARMHDRVALLWRRDGAMKFALCAATGQLQPAETVDIIDRPPPEGSAGDIIGYFVWTVLGVTLAAMFLFRPRSAPRPFTLPPTVRPARLLRRLAAGLTDLLPFSLIAGLIFRPPPEILEKPLNFDNFAEVVNKMQQLDSSAYCVILTIVSYIAYCILMEYRSGTTLGKRLFKLRVVGNEGARPHLREVVLRNLLKGVELMPPQVLLLFPLINRNRQRLGDLFAQTAVVEQLKTPPPEGDAPGLPPEGDAPAPPPDGDAPAPPPGLPPDSDGD